ncbi:MAG: carboxylating nicotinate-nucleotide diphosphorylase [Gammaproteobacteria bacterium]|nr:carboxylating nicotinate-nucleotide diphosphorylase [Gammaproteobacteria bacterium]MDH5691749.1 carboxylating nicotinate-nucleotide diphosphorylase [Gammaproteobacteria bacterium]
MKFPINNEALEKEVRHALEEDVGSGDITAGLIPEDKRCKAKLISREHAVIAGRPWFDKVFERVDPRVQIQWHLDEGDAVSAGALLCSLNGPARSILTAERTALNFLQTLSGTATSVNEYVELLKGTRTQLLDTRKTLPGLRHAQKYAVRVGGGVNHRIGLYDTVLIKENHIASAGSIQAAVDQARAQGKSDFIEVEVEDLQQLEEALTAKVDRVLLDNMGVAMLRKAVEQTRGRADLEASGNIDQDNIRDIAATGVDFVSLGTITKNLRAIDLSLRIVE